MDLLASWPSLLLIINHSCATHSFYRLSFSIILSYLSNPHCHDARDLIGLAPAWATLRTPINFIVYVYAYIELVKRFWSINSGCQISRIWADFTWRELNSKQIIKKIIYSLGLTSSHICKFWSRIISLEVVLSFHLLIYIDVDKQGILYFLSCFFFFKVVLHL